MANGNLRKPRSQWPRFSHYDLDYSMHSPDPSDPAITARVLIVMLAEEC